jgi:diguanylate cyclase (GGDEF)-like protein
VNDAADPRNAAARAAEHDLARLNTRVEAMRSVLIGLLQDVARAESRLDRSQAAHLVEANEQLVVTALTAQTEAETSAHSLREVSRAAEFDALTQLPTRALMEDRCANAIAHAKRNGTLLALLFVDLDDFKQINDTFGHATGDAVLKQVGHCLASSIRAGDTASRHGGDEFLVLLPEISQPSDAVLIAEKLIATLVALGQSGDASPRFSASIGISLYPDDGEDAQTLIAHADAAMYVAKRHGHGSVAVHGQPPAGAPGQKAPPAALQRREDALAQALAESELRHCQLREANEKLLLAALKAQELQSAAEQARQHQAKVMASVARELRSALARRPRVRTPSSSD